MLGACLAIVILAGIGCQSSAEVLQLHQPWQRLTSYGSTVQLAVQGRAGRRSLLQDAATDCPQCSNQLSACVMDDTCLNYFLCMSPCGQDMACGNMCTHQYGDNALVAAFNACVQEYLCGVSKTDCPCDPPQRSIAEVQRQVALNTLRGTYDVVYGLTADFDCVGSQQMTFSLTPSTAKGRPFNATYTIYPYENITSAIRLNVDAMNKTTGAWVTHYVASGITGSDTYYVLDSARNGRYWYVLIVYCTDLKMACLKGGFVLTKRLPASQRQPVPAGVLDRFRAALERTGWAAARNASWDQWCAVKPR